MQTNHKEKAARLYNKAEDTARRISAQAGGVKDALKRQYEISSMKAKVIRLELSLKKDFENAGQAIYAQCGAEDDDVSAYADRVLALFAEIDSKRDLIREMRACILSMEDTSENMPFYTGDMAQWDDEDEDDEDFDAENVGTKPASEAVQEDAE